MTDEPHLSTKDRPGDYDAIETAKPGEPLFPLQGGDPLAPATVQFWADYARARSRACLVGAKVVPHSTFDLTDERPGYEPSGADQREAQRLLRKATQAEEVSWAFTAYQRNEVEPTGGRATYNEDSGVDLSAEAQALVDERKARITMAGQLNNALSIAFEVAEGLSKRRILSTADMKIREAVEMLKDAARDVEPRRGNERS